MSEPEQDPPEKREKEARGAMSFAEHLEELRQRMLRALLAFAVGAGVAYWLRRELLAWVTEPLHAACTAVGQSCHLSALGLAGGFVAYVKLSALGGALLALPFVLYQVWAFVSPGLYSRERRFAVPFVLCSMGLFLAGALLCRQWVLPQAITFLMKESVDIPPILTVQDYFGFFLTLLVAFGAVFELPLVVFFLAIAGLVDHRDLLKVWRYFVVGAFALAALLTPPDPMSQLLLAGALCALYAVSIVVARVFSRKRDGVRSDWLPLLAFAALSEWWRGKWEPRLGVT